MLGDCYGAAIVESLSRKELEIMDKLADTNDEEIGNLENQEKKDLGVDNVATDL